MADLTTYARDPVAFIDRYITRNERGQPFALLPHQREILGVLFAFDAEGRLPYDNIIWSCVKKSGKTTLSGMLKLWWGFTQEAPNELKAVANDQEQAVARTFNTCVKLLKYNPELGDSARVTGKTIVLSNGTTIQAIANDFSGEAGGNQGWSSWTELWAFTSESSRRLWEELTPVPTRRNSIRFIDTYAGFEGESDLLFTLYKSVVSPDEHPEGQGERVHDTWPIFANRDARVIAYWDHEPRMPWQTPAYYAAQRRTLRASSYLRLHENRWTQGVSTFVTPELWDPCVLPDLRPEIGAPRGSLFVGVDAGIKHDSAAVVAVRWDGPVLRLSSHRIWQPTPKDPLDIENTIEAYLLELRARGGLARVVCDPYQLHRSISTLKAAGMPIEEYPQTVPNLTAAGQSLFDLLNGQNIRMYPAADVRQQAMATVAVESARGWRIAKEKASRKIDVIVALAMACRAAMEQPYSGNRNATSEAVWGGSSHSDDTVHSIRG